MRDQVDFNSVGGTIQQAQSGDEGSEGGLLRLKRDDGSVVQCFHRDVDFVVVELSPDGKFHAGGATSRIDRLYGKKAMLTFRGSVQGTPSNCTFVDAIIFD
jgi:hypothetical protein